MTQHTELIERLRKGVEAMDDCSDGVALIKCDALMSAGANALGAQAREIAELKAQESELCTLYGLAQAECKKLRAEIEGLSKDAERYQFLRDTCWLDTPLEHVICLQLNAKWDRAIDEAIDAAKEPQP